MRIDAIHRDRPSQRNLLQFSIIVVALQSGAARAHKVGAIFQHQHVRHIRSCVDLTQLDDLPHAHVLVSVAHHSGSVSLSFAFLDLKNRVVQRKLPPHVSVGRSDVPERPARASKAGRISDVQQEEGNRVDDNPSQFMDRTVGSVPLFGAASLLDLLLRYLQLAKGQHVFVEHSRAVERFASAAASAVVLAKVCRDAGLVVVHGHTGKVAEIAGERAEGLSKVLSIESEADLSFDQI